MAVNRRSSPRFGAMLLFAFLGLAAGYFLITTTNVEARTPQGPSARDILNKAAAIEEQEMTIADIIARVDVLGRICEVNTDINVDCLLACESNCCYANGDTGCDNEECETAVCDADSFCCDVTWDSLCGNEALQLCGTLCEDCDVPTGACCFYAPEFNGMECMEMTQAECVEEYDGQYQGDGTICQTDTCDDGGSPE